MGHERALESHQVNGAPGNVVRYALNPADQNVFVPAIHDRGREPAMVQAIGGNEKGAFGFRHRTHERTEKRMVATDLLNLFKMCRFLPVRSGLCPVGGEDVARLQKGAGENREVTAFAATIEATVGQRSSSAVGCWERAALGDGKSRRPCPGQGQRGTCP